ncbi:MAG: DUF342 domain-containing protein, partial [Acetomicrobium sp.]
MYAREDGVYIEVKPGKDVSKVEIIGYLKRQGIEVEGNLIDEIIDQRRGEIVKISDEVPSGTGEATIEVDISEDGIEALIHIIPPLDETNWPSPKDLEDELKKA